jgi:hypothetical protein
MNYYVYVFLRTDKPGYFEYSEDLKFDFEPFYIGKGILDRIDTSKYKTGNKLKNNIIEKLHRNDMQIKSIKIKTNLNEAEAFEYERYCIEKIGRILLNTGTLSNLTNGGEGMSKHHILQYDIDGNFIKEYKSLSEAQMETNVKNISYCCSGKRNLAGKFIWRYKIDNIPLKISIDFLKNMEHFGNYERKVIQYDINGNFVEKFNSIKEASIKTGSTSPRIVDVCKGNRNKTNGFIFKYETNSSPIDIINK